MVSQKVQFALLGLTHAWFLAAGSWHPQAVALQAGADTGARTEEGADTGGGGSQEAGAQAGEGALTRWPPVMHSAAALSSRPAFRALCHCNGARWSGTAGATMTPASHMNATHAVAYVPSSAQDPEHSDGRRKSERRQCTAMQTWRSAPRSRTCRRTRFAEKQTTPRGSARASLTRPRPAPSVRHPLSKTLCASATLLACAAHAQHNILDLSSHVAEQSPVGMSY